MNKGLLYAAGAYIAWGILPIFWKALHTVPALEILSHRISWALLVALVFCAVRGRLQWLGQALRNRKTVLVFAASGFLLGINWLIYIWAVNAGYVIESSLGYFITPLVNVLLGVVFLRERLRAGQAAAVVVALAGVVFLAIQYGRLPWIALILALSFGAYGLLRKTAPIGGVEGLTLETLLIAPPALVYLIFLEINGSAAFAHTDPLTTIMLASTGILTCIPLLLFSAGARRITMTSLGILQYIAPSIQFGLGVLVYGEILSPAQLAGFCLIWLALAIYTIDGMLRSGMRATARPAGS